MGKQKSFTLIELLVVIAVIGLISSIVLVSLKGAREKARESKMSETLYQVELAAQLDFDKYENWSSDVCPVKEGLGGCPAACVCQSDPPRFVQEGNLPSSAYNNIKWYCPTCCFDWQLWPGDWVSIDVYKCTPSGIDIVRRRCMGTNPSCVSY